jgi:hypothetical protein
MSCTLCVGALPDGEWCRACGEGLPEQSALAAPRPFFNGTGCGHPPDPVALLGPEGHWVCHCGWILDPDEGLTIEGAPGPVVACSRCGCGVAVPVAALDDKDRPAR